MNAAVVPQIFDKRPPFVRFEEREMGLDPEATEKAKRPIPRVVHMACITPHGSKDVVERTADEWLKQIRRQAMTGAYSLEWVNFFERAYEEWKKGNELPREGTPVATWPMAHGEARTRIRAAGFSTVEDLAEIPDSALQSIGLDGRYWRDTARAWVNEARDKGINAKEIADAKARIVELEATVQRQAERNAALERRLEEIDTKVETPRRGRAEKG